MTDDLKFDHGSIEHVATVPEFRKYNTPNGYLIPGNRACHALFYYHMLARRRYEEESETIKLEGDDAETDYKVMLQSICKLYGCKPEEAIRFWPEVIAQCIKLGVPTLLDEEKYRHNKPTEIKTDA